MGQGFECPRSVDGLAFRHLKTSIKLQNHGEKKRKPNMPKRKTSDSALDIERNTTEELGCDPQQDFCGYFETSKLKLELEKSGFVLLSGDLMKQLLLFFGANIEDLNNLEAGKIHAELPPDPEPKMDHRRIAVHRILFEPKQRTNSNSNEESFNFVPALTQMVTKIPEEEIASTAEDGTKLDYKRSGLRYGPMPPSSYAEKSSVPMAMALLNAELLPERHHPQVNINHEHKTTVNDQLLIRTTRKPLANESYSPTPEGIHQDSTEISSVTLVSLRGVVSGGESRLWRLDAPRGNYSEEEFNKDYMKNNLLLSHAIRNPWETLYFNDRIVKHEARAFDGERPCVRDVIVNFLRKPLKYGYDKKLVNGSIVRL